MGRGDTKAPSTEIPLVELHSTEAFNALGTKEKLYAHYLSLASWNGGLIVLIQTSPESPIIFSLLHRLFLAEPLDSLKQSALAAGVTEEDIDKFLLYICEFYGNSGNYRYFGNAKFIPELSKEKLYILIKSSAAYKNDSKKIDSLWQKCQNKLYSLEDNEKSLGLGDQGVTTYFSANCDEKDAELISEWFKEKKFEGWNSRAFKTVNEFGKVSYDIKLAAIEKSITIPPEEFKDCIFQVSSGDYSPLLELVNQHLVEAQTAAGNDREQRMIGHYINHFKSGSLEEHKDGSREWIKNKGPSVEVYIGFIETYRDPVGIRGEFEGFVAMVNKETSEKFSVLVDNAENFLTLLPWGKDLEKDVFLRPDFTSLEVMTFSGSNIPAGINIPNYEEIRQIEGFKNVSLGNVITSSYQLKANIPFLSAADKKIMEDYRVKAFDVQVGLHELLGHGSGKLFMKFEDGTYNFDTETVRNPLTGELIQSWYGPGETYDSVFKTIGSSMEECRAESVGLYLGLNKTVLKIFGFEGEEADNIIYANWLNLIWIGVAKATEVYNVEKSIWGQAHSQARFVITRMLIDTAKDLIKIEEIDEGKDLLLTVDRTKIADVGEKAISDFLVKLQTYKATADYEQAKEMYDRYSEVSNDGEYPFLKWRDLVIANKDPRAIYVQPNTTLNDTGNDVILKAYENNTSGLVQSWIDRFPNTKILDILEKLWEDDSIHFPQ